MRPRQKISRSYFVVQLTCKACSGIVCSLLTCGLCDVEVILLEEDSLIQGERRVSRLRGIQGSEDKLI